MAIEGLEIAPGGIGSGEAQVFKTPFTERAFMMKNEQERVRKAQEEEQFANELAKIDVNGIHTPDAEDINKQYQELIDSYANVKNAKGRNERLKNKVLYEQKKKDLLMNIGSSKAYSKNLLSVGEKMLGSPEEWEENSRLMFQDYKNNKSFGRTIDETKFRKKAKEEDIIKIKDDIIKYALVETKSPEATTLGGKAGVMTRTKKTLSPDLYVDGFEFKIKEKPGFYTSLLASYKSDYEKTPEYAKDGDKGFLNYAVRQEYAKDLAKLKASEEATFNADYVANNNNSTFNFGNGGLTTAPNWQDPIAGTLNINRTENINGVDFKTQESVPVLESAGVDVKFKFTPSEGYFTSDGKYMRSDKPIDVESSRVVIMPVVKGLKSGYALVPNSVSTTESSGGKTVSKSAKIPSNWEYVSFVEAVDPKTRKTIFIPLESVPQDRITRADYPAFKFIIDKGAKTSLRQLGKSSAPANNNTPQTEIPKGKVR